MNVGTNIREKREALGMSKAELGRRTAVTGASIYYFEEGIKVPSLTRLCQIANALNCSVSELLGER